MHHLHAKTKVFLPQICEVISADNDASQSCRFSHGTAQMFLHNAHKTCWGVMAIFQVDLVWEGITEVQIIFESNAYLPPNFLLNADFQNVKLYFHPYIFSQCIKEKALLFWSAYL